MLLVPLLMIFLPLEAVVEATVCEVAFFAKVIGAIEETFLGKIGLDEKECALS